VVSKSIPKVTEEGHLATSVHEGLIARIKPAGILPHALGSVENIPVVDISFEGPIVNTPFCATIPMCVILGPVAVFCVPPVTLYRSADLLQAFASVGPPLDLLCVFGLGDQAFANYS
jgi:hypothetical protein